MTIFSAIYKLMQVIGIIRTVATEVEEISNAINKNMKEATEAEKQVIEELSSVKDSVTIIVTDVQETKKWVAGGVNDISTTLRIEK